MPLGVTRPVLLAEELVDQPVLSRFSSPNSEPGANTPKSCSSISSLPAKSTFANERPCSLANHDNLVDDIPKPISLASFLSRFVPFLHNKSASPIDLDATATKRSVYDDPNLAQYYWPKEDYENLHRFDVTARWTIREERVNLSFFWCSPCVDIAWDDAHDRLWSGRLIGELCSGVRWTVK